MLYPMLHLHRCESIPSTDHVAPPVSNDYYLQPARLVDIDPRDGGGSRLLVECWGAEGGIVVDVNESPDMIRQGIVEAISAQAAASTRGAIQMQLNAQQELQKKASGIAIPRINGG